MIWSKVACAFVLIAIVIQAAGCSRRDTAVKRGTEHDPWVIRTDFSNANEWTRICELIAAPQTDMGMKFYAYVRFVGDEKFRGKEARDVVVALPDEYRAHFCFVVDGQCITNPEHSILVVGFYPSDGKSFTRKPRDTPAGDVATFRALPSQIQSIENNLSIANVDFEEFAKSVGGDGIYRGVSR